MKQKQCPHCQESSQAYEFTCAHCGEELTDNGYLIDSLTYWDVKEPPPPARVLLSLTLVSVSAIAAAWLHTPIILYAGIAAAGVYYTTAKPKEA